MSPCGAGGQSVISVHCLLKSPVASQASAFIMFCRVAVRGYPRGVHLDLCDCFLSSLLSIRAHSKKSSLRAAINKCAEENPKLHAAKEKRGICSIQDDDAEYEEILNNARRKLAIKRASAMHCKVATLANTSGSSWWRPCASDGLKVKRKDRMLHVQSKIMKTNPSNRKDREPE